MQQTLSFDMHRMCYTCRLQLHALNVSKPVNATHLSYACEFICRTLMPSYNINAKHETLLSENALIVSRHSAL